MNLLFASDHAGFELKNALVAYARTLAYDVSDLGAYAYEPEDDYPAIIARAAERVAKDPTGTRAIVLGGSGQGEAIVANRFPGVRAVVYNGESRGALFSDMDEIRLSREHNDANVLSLGARFLTEREAREVLRRWLETPFSGEARHARRIAAIDTVCVRS
ncbi:MAG: RpiB/LacA/LacB family sugar-phosphate isomerase [Candidatus Pacebacteria bacterium]|nr:RpiB/LacA/LacB family sugar-phosphate isomerase [Candidatus Paceibacterota bacterium]